MIKYWRGNSFIKLKKLEDNSINMMFIDPPYFIGYAKWDKKRSNEEFQRFFTELIILVNAKLKDNGTVWFCMAKDWCFANKDKNVEKGLVNILEEHGYVHLDNMITWGRQKGRGSKKKLKSLREEIIHYTKSKKYVWNDVQVLREVVTPYVKDGKPRGWFVGENGMRVRWTGLGNVWFYSSPQWNGILDKQRHSAQKPFLLIERLILLSSNENDLIVDPFAGSFTSAIVSKYHKRNYIGIEKDKKIFRDNVDFIKVNYDNIIKEFEKSKISVK